MASRAKAKPPKKRQQRATSNIFAMFDQSQIQEYKEAFNIIDHDRVSLIYLFSIFLIVCFRMVLSVEMILKICLLH
jgi:Ca2+-binding EF-hand superfamily protein